MIFAKYKSRSNEEGLQSSGGYFHTALLWLQHHHGGASTGVKQANLEESSHVIMRTKCPSAYFLGRPKELAVFEVLLWVADDHSGQTVLVLFVWKDPQGANDVFSSLGVTEIRPLLLFYPDHKAPVLWWHLLGIRVQHESWYIGGTRSGWIILFSVDQVEGFCSWFPRQKSYRSHLYFFPFFPSPPAQLMLSKKYC